MTALPPMKPQADYFDGHFLWQSLIERKRAILGASLVFFLFIFSYSLFQPKKFQANILLQIHQNRHHSVSTVPQSAQPSALDNLPEQSLAMQIALIRSKFILLPVIHSLQLTQHLKKSESQILRQMQNRLSLMDLSNSSENVNNKAGIIQIAYIGEDPLLTAQILNEIARVLQQKNREYKISDIEKKLAFLSQQLPLIKQSLQQSEKELNQYKSSTGKMNIPLQTRYLTSHLADLDKQLQELRFKRSDLLQLYTERYPFIQVMSQKINELEEQRRRTYNDLKKLPAEDQLGETLSRDMHTKNKLYLTILNQVQELEVAKAGVISDIHILAAATPPDLAISTQRSLFAFFILIIGFLLSCFAVIIWHIFSRRIQDPFWLEKMFQIQHLGTVPLSQNQNARTQEALCYLRTYLQLQRERSSSSSFLMSFIGLSGQVGKTFIVAHLARLLSGLDQKVLLIDANLRNSHLHTHFLLGPQPGLREVLEGKKTISEVLISMKETPGLHFLPAGTGSNHPTDLLAGEGFKKIIQETAGAYSFILINSSTADFPSDCFSIASLSHFNCLIFAAGKHQTTQALSSITRLKQLGLQMHGSLFNHTKPVDRWLPRFRDIYRMCRNVFDTKADPHTHEGRLNSRAERPYWERS